MDTHTQRRTAAYDRNYLPQSAVSPNGETALWAIFHTRAIMAPLPIEAPIVNGLDAWLAYADYQAQEYGSKIGADYVLGDAWAAWGFALLTLLNGATGRLDCGTLDAILRDTLEALLAVGDNPAAFITLRRVASGHA